MDKIAMSSEILNIIHAVLDYKRFVLSNNMVFHKIGFDQYKETREYYNTLPLPDGLKHNHLDFERILNYEHDAEKLHILNSTETCDLSQYYF